ncbi:vWA domain-containing protein [Bacillus marinisedimentorum]|uniref:vWA domain-containing protein n=1 Tax=Bacillus marinisedimentorum TaxID=1821260 RepID=UPI000871B8B3|nr:VWA domain-containing protein [Bacillus marinisedimentorum]
MKARKLLLAALMIFVTGACSNEAVDEQKPDEQVKGTVSENEAGQDSSSDSEDSEILVPINDMILQETIEDLQNSKPGILTSEFSFEDETSHWAPVNALKGIEEETKRKLAETAEMTDDPGQLYKALLYHLGSNAYASAANDLAGIEPDFDEPMFPELDQLIGSPEVNQQEKGKAIILLDASSSMLLDVKGEQKMKTAKRAVRSFAKTIGSDNEMSLFVYGHKGTQADKDKTVSCNGIEEIYTMQDYNEEQFYKAVANVDAKGWTPLAAAIQKAGEAGSQYNGDLTIYIVSDGAETCDGNPIEEAKKFAEANDGRNVNIIGFDVDQEAENQLKEVAAAGNGEYLPADSPEELNDQMTKKWVPRWVDIHSVRRQSPKGTFAISFQKLNIDKAAMTLTGAVKTETSRMLHAIRMMKNEDMISDGLSEKLTTMNEERKQLLLSMVEDEQAKKREEIDKEVERIDQKVQAYADKLEELRNQGQ